MAKKLTKAETAEERWPKAKEVADRTGMSLEEARSAIAQAQAAPVDKAELDHALRLGKFLPAKPWRDVMKVAMCGDCRPGDDCPKARCPCHGGDQTTCCECVPVPPFKKTQTQVLEEQRDALLVVAEQLRDKLDSIRWLVADHKSGMLRDDNIVPAIDRTAALALGEPEDIVRKRK